MFALLLLLFREPDSVLHVADLSGRGPNVPHDSADVFTATLRVAPFGLALLGHPLLALPHAVFLQEVLQGLGQFLVVALKAEFGEVGLLLLPVEHLRPQQLFVNLL